MRRLFPALALVGSCFAGFLLVEGGLRWRDATDPFIVDERNTVYRYDAALGWFPSPGIDTVFEGSRSFSVRHNSWGFRDVEHGAKTKPRLAVLGDSFVYGYDVEAECRFTDILRRRRPDLEIVNMGVSGYGTDQEWLLLQQWFDRVKPDEVLLVFDDPDLANNASNSAYGYYKPYFREEGGALILHGTPVPKAVQYHASRHPWLFESLAVREAASHLLVPMLPPEQVFRDPSRPLLAAMRDWVEAKGARFAVGFADRTWYNRPWCARHRLSCIDLETPHRFKEGGGHWTPEGHAEVARRIAAFLARRSGLGRAKNGGEGGAP